MSTVDRRVNDLLLRHAREALIDQPREPMTMPIDRRCPSCGVERDGCDRPFCLRYLSEGEA